MARRGFARPRRPRQVGRKIIIVCEGKKSETQYFNSIRTELRLPTVRVRVIHPDATDPLSIVEAAIEERQTLIADDSWISKDSAWAVFDGDEHRLTSVDRWDKALSTAESKSINLAVSNPSFELWYLLHFSEQNSSIDRKKVITELKKYIPKYSKARTLYPDPLAPLTEMAVGRAVALRKQLLRNYQNCYSNPCTHVDCLISEILSLKRYTR